MHFPYLLPSYDIALVDERRFVVTLTIVTPVSSSRKYAFTSFLIARQFISDVTDSRDISSVKMPTVCVYRLVATGVSVFFLECSTSIMMKQECTRLPDPFQKFLILNG
jgi:hypothetical protein